MRTFIFKRPVRQGFSGTLPEDFVRVDIMIANDRHFWSYNDSSTVYEIQYKKDDAHQDIHRTAYVLARMYDWEYIGVVR